MDLRSKLRAIVRPEHSSLTRGSVAPPVRELTYEPDAGGPLNYEAGVEPTRVGEILGGRPVSTRFGECLIIDRRYESNRRHGDVLIEDCQVSTADSLKVLDPSLLVDARLRRTMFIDLETTGLSGGAGTVAFLVGCGYFDIGAFQVRQFLLTSFTAERALLEAVSQFVEDADLIVTYNGKTFDVPVMETRWSFHRMEMPLDGVPHFDALHAARRLWKTRPEDPSTTLRAVAASDGCRLITLERALFDVRRIGDVPGFEIPSRFFRFLRSGDPRPLEPVLEHNRLDLVSLAAVTARAARLVDDGAEGCPDSAQALALGRIYERAGSRDRAEACYRRASNAGDGATRAEGLYRLGLLMRRDRRFVDAADVWRALLTATEERTVSHTEAGRALKQFAVEALAIHAEHRDRDLCAARELALFALEDSPHGRRADSYRHRLARVERKIAEKRNAQLFWS
jgi:uncharacterized protein